MIFKSPTGAYLRLETVVSENVEILQESLAEGVCILWSTQGGNVLKVDGQEMPLGIQQVLFVTEFHRLEALHLTEIRLIRFNRSFYCIRDHDHEVSCKGLLFYAAEGVPTIQIVQMDLEQFYMLWKLFPYEMETRDSLQYEMLQVMLKRWIILCTRTYKMQHDISINTGELDLFREFNYLVEMNFRQLHTVADYAALLYKSPKTLSNTFARYNKARPLEVIQDRIVLEARRQLMFSEVPIKEIAYDLGFEDLQRFSRLFKRKTGQAPQQYRELQGKR